MSSCITRSGAVWVTGDAKSRERLDDAVYSAIRYTKENLNSFPKAISKMVVDYLEEYPGFGEREWTDLCGRVDPAPPLPPGFSDIWYGPCSINPGKTISETHVLVYIPATIDGKPFTLNKLGELAKRFFPKNDNGYRYWSDIVDELGDQSIKPHWVLMTKHVIPGSKNKTYAEQQEMVARLAKKSLNYYKIPSTLEAATCILTQYFFDSKIRLFNDDPWTYTLCEEKVQNWQTVVGGFTSDGLCINDYNFGNPHLGVAVLREL